eukprot:1147632-Pelagomonas_calceolata.AAC.2
MHSGTPTKSASSTSTTSPLIGGPEQAPPAGHDHPSSSSKQHATPNSSSSSQDQGDVAQPTPSDSPARMSLEMLRGQWGAISTGIKTCTAEHTCMLMHSLMELYMHGSSTEAYLVKHRHQIHSAHVFAGNATAGAEVLVRHASSISHLEELMNHMIALDQWAGTPLRLEGSTESGMKSKNIPAFADCEHSLPTFT